MADVLAPEQCRKICSILKLQISKRIWIKAFIIGSRNFLVEDFQLPDLCFPCTGISNTLAEAARDSLMEELEEILAGGLGGTKLFLVHGDGGTEEDEEGGSQKGEAQE